MNDAVRNTCQTEGCRKGFPVFFVYFPVLIIVFLKELYHVAHEWWNMDTFVQMFCKYNFIVLLQ